jgi:hypothetical protein
VQEFADLAASPSVSTNWQGGGCQDDDGDDGDTDAIGKVFHTGRPSGTSTGHSRW